MPSKMPSPTSTMGTPWAKGIITSGTNREKIMAPMPPTNVKSAAFRVNRFQKTLKSNAMTNGGVTAAVNAPWAA